MSFIGITRLRVRSVRFLPAFAVHFLRSDMCGVLMSPRRGFFEPPTNTRPYSDDTTRFRPSAFAA
jgi:hypothetical protein